MAAHSEGEDEDLPEETVIHALLPETQLVERLRSGTGTDGAAVRELQRRHLPAVVDYAQQFTTSRPAGWQLADEALFLAMEEVCEGVDPSGTWRHHALTHVRETARVWAAGNRRERLRPDFLRWARTADVTLESEPPNVMTAAFYQLPERLRSALWYAVVDDEPDSEVATWLGSPTGAVADLAAKAQVAMRDAYMQEHLSRHGTAECSGFRRIIEAAAQARDGHLHPDLAAHLTHCTECGVLLSRITKLSRSPRVLLAEGLLTWGGAAYAERVPSHTIAEKTSPEQGTSPLADGQETPPGGRTAVVEVAKDPGRTRPAHRSVSAHQTVKAVSGIATVVAVAVAVMAAYDVLPESWDAGGLVHPQPSRSADPSSSAAAGTPSGGATPSRTPVAPVSVGETAQIVNAAAGLCLDVENQVVQKRVDAVAAPCSSGATTQRWTFDTDGHLHNSADPSFCLKVDGDSTGVGIRPCTSNDPDKRARMTFVIGENGEIRSRPRPDQVIVPVGSATGTVLPLVHKESSAAGSERWAARPVATLEASLSPTAGAS
ncbi:ricin-type beta-trefoil lectin domain protein [Streptomyces chartreusis]|uniref:ricin-type beta-trefoil lectin domain protein n=1 Tax=Streptomyces chartreusis TaxID=1969 RepID=UPI00362ED9AB